jgi:hypothetical protein
MYAGSRIAISDQQSAFWRRDEWGFTGTNILAARFTTITNSTLSVKISSLLVADR